MWYDVSDSIPALFARMQLRAVDKNASRYLPELEANLPSWLTRDFLPLPSRIDCYCNCWVCCLVEPRVILRLVGKL